MKLLHGTADKAEKSEPVDMGVTDLNRRLSNVEAELEGLRRRVKQFDYDLQDAIDGFYRRRQSDRMREVREEEAPKKRLTTNQILQRAVDNLTREKDE